MKKVSKRSTQKKIKKVEIMKNSKILRTDIIPDWKMKMSKNRHTEVDASAGKGQGLFEESEYSSL